MSQPKLLVVDLYPSLLQPEGDHGNAVTLVSRARRRGVDASLFTAHPGDEIPAADIFVIGGSADIDLGVCADRLRASGVVNEAVDKGATVLGVGGGFCVLAHSFVDASGHTHKGTGVLDVVIEPHEWASGPVVTLASSSLPLPAMSGYELHNARAVRGAAVEPLASLEIGLGDGPPAAPTDGAVAGHVIGTWVHGPLLPRNHELADLMLGWAIPNLTQTALPGDDLIAAVRAKRMAEARSKG